jgi:cell division protein FtsQ
MIQDDMLKSFFNLVKAAVLLVLCFFVLKAYAAWLKKSESFKIRKIEIEGNAMISDQNIIKTTELASETSIWEVDLQSADSKIRENPLIEAVSLERSFPGVIKIKIHEKNPLALLNFKNRFYCIDRNGVVLPSKSGKLYDLPVISGHFEGGVQTGKTVRSKVVEKGLDFLKTLVRERPELFNEISEIVLKKEHGLVFFTRNGGIPVRLGESGYAWKIRYLEAILGEIYQQSNLKKIRFIDLRYNNQVVVGERA